MITIITFTDIQNVKLTLPYHPATTADASSLKIKSWNS